VIRGDEGDVPVAGESQTAETDAEGRVGVDDLRVPDARRNLGGAEAEPVVEGERQAPDRVLAVVRPVAVGVGVDHVHPTARSLPAVAPRRDGVGHAVDGRQIGVGERGDLFHCWPLWEPILKTL